MELPEAVPWWMISDEAAVLEHGVMDKDCFYSLAVDSGRLYITDLVNKTIESITLPDEHVLHITYDGQNFWYILNGSLDIICWNRTQGVVDRYLIPRDIEYEYELVYYLGIFFAGGNLFVASVDGRFLYVLERDKRKLRKLYHIIDYDRVGRVIAEPVPYFKFHKGSLICMYQSADVFLEIDLNTLEIKHLNMDFCMEKPIQKVAQEYINTILLDRKALLYENTQDVGLGQLLQYCLNGVLKN